MFSILFLQSVVFPQDLAKTDLLSSLAQLGECFLRTEEKKKSYLKSITADCAG